MDQKIKKKLEYKEVPEFNKRFYKKQFGHIPWMANLDPQMKEWINRPPE